MTSTCSGSGKSNNNAKIFPRKLYAVITEYYDDKIAG
jgi:hypothetical protein